MEKDYKFSAGFWFAFLTSFLAVLTFGIAICTPPVSGPFCQGGCVSYPYNDIASRFPRDYYWMVPAMILAIVFVALMVAVHLFASEKFKVFSLTGISLAIVSAVFLLGDYYIQLAVIQPSLINGEFEGIAILSQYNPHGIFIALEEIGYIIMSLAMLIIVPVFTGPGKLKNAIRWTFTISFLLLVFSFVFFSFKYGIQREYRFEVAAITIVYFELIVSGILLTLIFRNHSFTKES
jgi:uncharacterized membrane protein YhaH (DUF805 family)